MNEAHHHVSLHYIRWYTTVCHHWPGPPPYYWHGAERPSPAFSVSDIAADRNLSLFCWPMVNCQCSMCIICDNFMKCYPLPSARQHPSYGDCLEVKKEYYQNCSVLGCVIQYSQSAAHSCEQFLQVQQIGFVTLGPLHCA